MKLRLGFVSEGHSECKQGTCQGLLCRASHLGVPTKAFIKANLIIFHCIFLKGCYDFLDVWWLVINQAFMMSCERPPLGLPPATSHRFKAGRVSQAEWTQLDLTLSLFVLRHS